MHFPSQRIANRRDFQECLGGDKKHKAPKPRDIESSSSDSSASDEDDFNEHTTDSGAIELPPDYWQIQKLVRYLRTGNQTATLIALCSLKEFDLKLEINQLAVKDAGGLDLLLNLLETEEFDCKVGSLQVLKDLCTLPNIRHTVTELCGLQTLVTVLFDTNPQLQALAAETIANIARFRRARTIVRREGGIPRLVDLLDNEMARGPKADLNVSRGTALALWSLSHSRHNKSDIRKSGGIPLLAKLLKCPHQEILIPVVGILEECASDHNYQLAIRTEGMIKDLVLNLRNGDLKLRTHCASAIYKCAEDAETRELVRVYGGLDPMVELLKYTDNEELMAACTGAIWMCAMDPSNMEIFVEMNVIDQLIGLLRNQPEEVLVKVIGAIGELCKNSENRTAIRKAGGIPYLVKLLTGTNQKLLINATKAVGTCAEDPESIAVIESLDGVRLLWSLLKNPRPEVQASAARAICPCIQNAKDSGEMVRSFVGGLELMVNLLKSKDVEVLSSVCSALAKVGEDEENLAVITDHGVVPLLAQLTTYPDNGLRWHVGKAIAQCCNWSPNRKSFGEEGAVPPLVEYLKSKDTRVQEAGCEALHQLSFEASNCIAMHQQRVVGHLLKLMNAPDESVHTSAAGCLQNIRYLALAAERVIHDHNQTQTKGADDRRRRRT